VGANTVEEQRFILTSARVKSGSYRYDVTAFVLQAAHTSGSPPQGFAWLYNPAGSSVTVAINSVEFLSQLAASQSMPASPRVCLQQFTLTADSDAPINGNPIDTTFPTSTAKVELGNADATMNVTLGADFFGFLTVASATNTITNYTWTTSSDWNPEEEGRLILAAGEGIRIYQPDDGKGNPQGDGTLRRFACNFRWTEFTTP
jgi:hypothetical protein